MFICHFIAQIHEKGGSKEHFTASDSPVTDMLSPVPPGDWYMPRSTKVVKEDLPEALTKPLVWYWGGGEVMSKHYGMFKCTLCP